MVLLCLQLLCTVYFQVSIHAFQGDDSSTRRQLEAFHANLVVSVQVLLQRVPSCWHRSIIRAQGHVWEFVGHVYEMKSKLSKLSLSNERLGDRNWVWRDRHWIKREDGSSRNI